MHNHHPDCPHSVLSDTIIIRNSMYPCKYCDVAEKAERRGYEAGLSSRPIYPTYIPPNVHPDTWFQHGQGENP